MNGVAGQFCTQPTWVANSTCLGCNPTNTLIQLDGNQKGIKDLECCLSLLQQIIFASKTKVCVMVLFLYVGSTIACKIAYTKWRNTSKTIHENLFIPCLVKTKKSQSRGFVINRCSAVGCATFDVRFLMLPFILESRLMKILTTSVLRRVVNPCNTAYEIWGNITWVFHS